MIDTNSERYVAGDAVRRQVLGTAYVDKSWANATDFTRPLAELVNDYCWGEIWTRPELDLRTRSFINLAMITALGRMEELRLHVRGAIHNGLTIEEIRETLLQTAIYCGIPAALDATRTAKAVLDEMAAEES